MQLSVIIPSYNGQSKLPKILQVIKGQLEQNDELWVINDASTDLSADIAHQHGASVYTLEHNSGVGRARNVGAQLATGEVLVFFDDDIIPDDDYLTRVRELFQGEALKCCQGLHSLVPANDTPTIWHRVEALLWRNEMGFLQTKKGKSVTLFSQSFCIRKDHFEKTGGFSEEFSGAGAEEFEYSSRLNEAGEIVMSDKLNTRHAFQDPWPRLKTLFKRASRFPRVYQGASAQWQKKQTMQFCRLFFAAIFMLGFIGVPFCLYSFYLVVLSIAGFLIIDFSILVKSIEWRVFSLFPITLIVRIVQYCAIGLGAMNGLIQVYVKRG